MSAACVWLIGGTSESVTLAHGLSAADVSFVVTVTTASARDLYPKAARVFVGALSASDMLVFVQKWQVRCILDASHPFADAVSRQAIALTQNQNADQDSCPAYIRPAYIRYERSEVSASGLRASHSASQNLEDNVIYVDSLDDLIEFDILRHQRVLFTVGYRYLAGVAPLRQTSVLFARVLPSVEAISGAIAAGFSAKEIVAMRPPISAELESALWQQWKITCVVAKASGVAGGERTKRAIAAQLGVTLVLVKRPQLTYPNQTDSVIAAVDFCSKTLSLY